MHENTNAGAAGGMDRFTRNYLIVLGLVLAAVAAYWLAQWNPAVGEINDLLAADTELAGYGYRFRVLSLDKGVAKLTTPRSFEVPVVRFLGVLHPELRNKAQDDPAMVAAQEQLVRHQKRAAQLVHDRAEVRSVRWVLDKDWYRERGVTLY